MSDTNQIVNSCHVIGLAMAFIGAMLLVGCDGSNEWDKLMKAEWQPRVGLYNYEQFKENVK